MKLHLPKLLRVALIAAVMGMSSAYSATLAVDNIAYPNDDTSTPGKEGAAYLDVGMEMATDTWTGDLVVGDTATTQGDVDYVGTFNSSWAFITPQGGSSNTTITSTLKVTGSLTLQGSGQIMLGGQNSSNYYGLDVADTLTVTGGSLKSTKIIAGNLVVNAGTVSTHTANCTSGNSYAGGTKQSYIKNSLTISGGTLNFGYIDNVQGIGTGSHRMTAFGSSASFVMSQTGGTMKVYGDMDMKSGTTINQSAGTMVLRDTIYMGSSGTTTVNQTGDDAKLVFGRFESTGTSSVCDFEINQSGAGLIHLAYGSNFAGSGTITLNQSGTGSILIGGEHNTSITGALPSRGYALAGSFEAINTTYKLNQTGSGSITVQNHGSVIFEEAVVRGSLNSQAGATIGACFSDLISNTEAPITVEGGSFAMSDGSYLGISFTKECLEGLDASKDKAGTEAKDFDVDLLVVDGDDDATLSVEPDVVLAGLDNRLWHLESVEHSTSGNDFNVKGTLVFTPWIKDTDGAESFKDVSSYLKVGLELENKTITLSKSNSHSLGTKIKNSTVTLSNASALGNGPVMTSGTSTVASSTTAKLPGTIQNSGDLTLKGKFSTTSDKLEQVGESESVLLSLAGQEATDGFAAEKSVHLLVSQESDAKVTFKSGATVKVNELTYALTQNGNDTVIEGEDVAIAAYTRDNTKYYMNTEGHDITLYEIWQKASNSAVVYMGENAGTLTVNKEYLSVDSKGGKIDIASGYAVKGSIENAVVSGDNGTVNADLKGGVTLKGTLNISGTGTTTGALALDDAAVTLGAATALGDAALSTAGASSLTTADNVTASIGATIENSGQLTLNGSYDATALAVTLDETHVDASGTTGNNGFVRDSGSMVQLVNNNGDEATLAVGDDFKVGVGEEEYALDTTTGVATAGAAIHYGTYFIADEDHSVAVDQIQVASGNQTDKVVMSAGSLNVNEDIAVEATGGAIAVKSGKEVTGSILDAVVTGENGTVGANLMGGVTLKGSLRLSGAGTTTGTLALDGAAVTLGSATALGNAAVSTSGTSSISAAGEVVIKMNQVISNTGTLTLNGSYDVSLLAAETIESAYVDADGNVTTDGNGFLRYEGCSVAVVDNAADGAALMLGDSFQVLKGDAAGTLDSATGVATFGAGIDYSVYHMVETDGQGETVSSILDKGGSDAQVDLATGKLTADADVKLNATGGELVTEGGTVSGSIADTSITANGGEIAADISGDSAVTVTGDTTISGENTSGAGINVNSAALVLGSATALGNGSIETEGTSSIAATEGVIANLGSTIQNSGELTLAGSFDVSGLEVQALDETHVDITGATGNNGFVRDSGSTVQVVENVAEGAGLTLGDGISLTIGTKEYVLDAETGVATAGAGTNYGTYFITEADHSVEVSEIQEASEHQTTKVVMNDGTLTTDEGMDVETTGGHLNTENGTVTGSIADTSITADGGEIAADISGESSVTVTGEAALSGDNSYTGDTVIAGEEAKLIVAAGSSLGTGKVLLDDHGTLDLGGNAISNDIEVTGCTLAGAGAYSGNMTVSGNLLLQDATTARSVTMTGKGSIAGADLTTDKLEVATTDNATIGGSLTINDNGTLTLNDGKVLTVGGSLTLGNGTSLVLNGDYAAGDKLLTSESGALTLGDVTLVYGDSTMEVEVQGGSLVLVSLFKQPYAESLVLNNWGMLTGSRSFVNAVRGQRTNTGCIANGRGTAWVAVMGVSHDLDGGDIDLQGSAIGADMKVGAASSVGVAFGYTEIDATPSGLSKVKQEGSYMALYGEHGLKKLSSTSCLSMDWVAAYGQTESKLHGQKWEQESLQLNTRLSWNKKVNDRLCVSVFGGVEYYTNESDTVDGVKTGSIQNLRGEVGVGARYVAWGTPAADAGKGGIIQSGCEKLVLHGELRYMNDMVRSNPVVRMNGMSGMGENPGRQGVGIEAGATYRFSQRWSASANYGINTMGDSREHRVNVGASFTF